jgi:hypothetical protein
MPTLQAIVNWTEEGGGMGSVADIIVPSGSGSTSITWTCGPNVASFAIDGLDPNEFAPPSSNGQVTTFTTVDADDRAQDYSYNVTAVHASGRPGRRHDPKIKNEG